ncbi:MAG: type II toxin-antitoxin system VapC family toxin [Nanoarchaeota archaeon]
MKKYLDSNIFLYPLLYEDEKAKKCKDLLIKMANSEIECITSFLTWDEVTYKIRRILGRDKSVIHGDLFLKMANLDIIAVDNKVIAKAQEIITKFNIAPRDAIHFATALLNNCDSFVTDDSDFDKIKEIKIEKI